MNSDGTKERSKEREEKGSTVRGRRGGKEPDEYVARWRGWGVEGCAANSQRQKEITNWIRRGGQSVGVGEDNNLRHSIPSPPSSYTSSCLGIAS